MLTKCQNFFLTFENCFLKIHQRQERQPLRTGFRGKVQVPEFKNLKEFLGFSRIKKNVNDKVFSIIFFLIFRTAPTSAPSLNMPWPATLCWWPAPSQATFRPWRTSSTTATRRSKMPPTSCFKLNQFIYF